MLPENYITFIVSSSRFQVELSGWIDYDEWSKNWNLDSHNMPVWYDGNIIPYYMLTNFNDPWSGLSSWFFKLFGYNILTLEASAYVSA